MRNYVRLLAPISILATALYMGYWASHSSNSNSMPITAVDNLRLSSNAANVGHMAAQPLHISKSKLSNATDRIAHP